MNIEVTDQLLQQLTEEWLDTLPERYPSRPKHPYRVSPGFRLKMWQLTHKADWDYSHGKDMTNFGTARNYHWTKRSMAALLAAALGTTVAMAYAVRYFQMVREEHEKYSLIYYEQIEDGYIPEEFICYTVGHIPDGFILKRETDTSSLHKETYIKTGDSSISFIFYQARMDDVSISIDTEDMEPEKILIAENQTGWYLGNPGNQVVYWDYGEYFFRVSGNVSKTDLLKIAASVHIKE